MSDPDFHTDKAKGPKPAAHGKGKSAGGTKAASKGKNARGIKATRKGTAVISRRSRAPESSPKIKFTVKDESEPGDSDLSMRLGVPSNEGKPRGTPSSSVQKLEQGASASPKPPVTLRDSGRALKGRRTKDTGSSAHTTDEDNAPPTRRRVQQSIKDHFAVRRSTRKCKMVLESEEIEKVAEKLKTKNEEGLAVTDVEGKGRGVVSTRPFRKGELVCEYSGELITYEEAKKREEEYGRDPSVGCYMYYYMFKTKKLCVDATRDNGRFGRLLNHSKTAPNVTTKLLEVSGEPYLCLMAARDIQPGEELQYDYGERSKAAIESHPWLKA